MNIKLYSNIPQEKLNPSAWSLSVFVKTRLDALLPICFIMCVLLLLNAFVLLNKVNQVDDLFTEILSKHDV